jgi:hypothetical protein
METSKKLYTATDFYNMFSSLVPDHILPYIVAQVAHETGDFKSKLLYDHNNATGITFANNSKLQKNAKKGRPLPEDSRYNYAIFDSINDWAIDYIRLIKRGKNKPMEAKDIDEYINRLKANNFFTANIDLYKTAVKKFIKKYGNIKPTKTGGLITIILIVVLFAALNK